MSCFMEHQCWVKIAQNLSNTPLHISIHYHSAPVVAMRSLSVSGCETIENLPLSASYHHHPSWLESWCSSLSSHSKWSHDFKEICITHTHTLLDPSHPIALLAWLSASIKDLVPGLAAALAAENPEVRICHAQLNLLNLLNLFNCSRTAWILLTC